jgi:hypothetical protein
MIDPSDTGESPEALAHVTVTDLDALVEEIFTQKVKIEEMGELVTLENKKLAALEAKGVAYLEALGRESYKHPRGTISIKESWRFNLPATDEDKFAFFTWLRERGLYDKYATVNSNSYNSLLLTEWEIAQHEGRAMEFSVPGVPQPKFYRRLGTLKGRG